MSRFYVGQRVRVNCTWSRHHGKETRIVALDVMGQVRSPTDLGNYIGHQVELVNGSTGTGCIFESHELEPITDCYDKTTWDKCVWQPNRQEVTL